MDKNWKISDFPKPVGKFTKMLCPSKNSRKDFLLFFKEIFNIELPCHSFKRSLPSFFYSLLFCFQWESRRKVAWTVTRTTADHNDWWHHEHAFWSHYTDGLYWHLNIIDTSGCSAGYGRLVLKKIINCFFCVGPQVKQTFNFVLPIAFLLQANHFFPRFYSPTHLPYLPVVCISHPNFCSRTNQMHLHKSYIWYSNSNINVGVHDSHAHTLISQVIFSTTLTLWT